MSLLPQLQAALALKAELTIVLQLTWSQFSESTDLSINESQRRQHVAGLRGHQVQLKMEEKDALKYGHKWNRVWAELGCHIINEIRNETEIYLPSEQMSSSKKHNL